jgi:hypothetical protein
MARRYSRDNRGRFASGGTGATARGGRLRTAAGNKRATQTTKAAAAKPSGAITGKVKRNPAAAGKIGKAKAATKRPARIKGAKINSLDAPNKASSAPKGTIGKTGKIRTAQAFDRNLAAAKLNAPAGRKNAVSVEQRYKTTTSDFASLGGSASGRLTRKQLDKRQRQGQKILNPTSSITDVSPTYSGMSSSMKQRVKEARATRFEGYKSAISAKRTAKPAAAKPAKAASSKGARLGGSRRTTNAAAPKNTTANRTGQSKTLNKFNSRPVGTMVAGKGINLVPSTKRVPLQVQRKESDLAFARVATKAARQRAAAPAKAAVRRTEANRTARALANQKRTAQAVVAKGGKRPSPTRKQKKSLSIADAARTFYSAKRVNSLPNFRVNTSKPGFRLPRNMR